MGEGLKNRSEIEEKYKWKLEDLIPSKEAAEALADEIEAEIPSYGQFKGRLGQSAEELLKYLVFDEGLDQKLSRLLCYSRQKYDEDTSLGETQALVSRARTLALKAREASSFAEPEILSIPEERMNQFLEEKSLSGYRLALLRLMAKREHMLSEAEEALLAGAEEMAETPSSVFSLFNNADIKFPPVEDENGILTEVTHGKYGSLLENRNRSVREAAFHSYYSAYRQFANTVAAVFEGNLKQASFFARTRRYSSTRDFYLSVNEIPEAVYDNLIEAVNKRLPSLHRYMALKKERLSLDRLHMYDLYAPMTSDFNRKYTYEEAKQLIADGLKPLGEEYGKILKDGFSGRWIDVYENRGKRSGGYSIHTYGVHPYVLMSYDDSLNSVLTLAHEMGHSLHSWYSAKNQPYPYAGYRIFVAEVASTCNEVLLLKKLMGRTEDEREREFLIGQLLERFRNTLFRQTLFAEFEWEVHKMCWQGIPLTKDVLCRLYHQLNETYYGPDVEVDSDIDYEWARIPHFYRPFYVYQYATGFAAATAIAGRILAGDKAVLEGYFKFLKGGCSKTPVELLKLCGLDMEKPDVVNEAMDVFEALLNDLDSRSEII